MPYQNPLVIPNNRIQRPTQQGFTFNPLLGIGGNLITQATENNPVLQITQVLTDRNTWFNVVAVIIGIACVLIGVQSIARKNV